MKGPRSTNFGIVCIEPAVTWLCPQQPEPCNCHWHPSPSLAPAPLLYEVFRPSYHKMISGSSVATLIIFIVSIIFVIYPISFRLRLPFFGRLRISINLTTAPILAIAILWASQCISATQIRDGIVGTGQRHINCQCYRAI